MMEIINSAELSGIPWLTLVMVLLAGFGLGLIFFGSLWLSTCQLVYSNRPVVWMLLGFILRMVVLLPAFYFLGAGQWQALLSALAGFICARMLLLQYKDKLPLLFSPALPKEQGIDGNKQESINAS